MWVTALGTVFHELGHYGVCRLLGVEVEDVELFNPPTDFLASPGTLGSVQTESSANISPRDRVLIYFAPLLTNFLVAGVSVLLINVVSNPLLVFILVWIAVSLSAHAIPSTVDTELALVTTEEFPAKWRRVGRLITGSTAYLSSAGISIGLIVLMVLVGLFLIRELLFLAAGLIVYWIIAESALYVYERYKGETPSIQRISQLGSEARDVSASHLEAMSEPEAYLGEDTLSDADSPETDPKTDQIPPKPDSEGTSDPTSNGGQLDVFLDGLEADRPSMRLRAATALLTFATVDESLLYQRRERIRDALETESHLQCRGVLIAAEMAATVSDPDAEATIQERLPVWTKGLGLPDETAREPVAAAFADLVGLHPTAMIPALIPLTNCILLDDQTIEPASEAVIRIVSQAPWVAGQVAPAYEQLIGAEDVPPIVELAACTVAAAAPLPSAHDRIKELTEHDEEFVSSVAGAALDIMDIELAESVEANLTAPQPP